MGKFFGVVLLVLAISPVYGQLTSIRFEGAYGYNPSNPMYYKAPLSLKVGVESWFLPRLAIGMSSQFCGTEYEYEKVTSINQEQELNIFNYAYSFNIVAKYAILKTDDFSLSFKTETGIGFLFSIPTIYITDLSSSIVTKEKYKKTSANLMHIELGLYGQYYLSEKWDLGVSIGYNNYDFSKSMNKLKLNEAWTNDFKRTFSLSFGVGLHYYIFGTSKR